MGHVVHRLLGALQLRAPQRAAAAGAATSCCCMRAVAAGTGKQVLQVFLPVWCWLQKADTHMTRVRMTAGGFQINRRGSMSTRELAGPTLAYLLLQCQPLHHGHLLQRSVEAASRWHASLSLEGVLCLQIAAPAYRLPFQQQRTVGTSPDSPSLQGALFAQQHLDTLSALTLRSAIAQRHGRGFCVLASRGRPGVPGSPSSPRRAAATQ